MELKKSQGAKIVMLPIWKLVSFQDGPSTIKKTRKLLGVCAGVSP